ncbi:MAG: rRNA pseudouridine synthase [Streptococcaceae bacterium]|jgi:16S rRNA pseudouridine516 synthase|nr:rRNA pseudouridine synthase [Streptococcaceae bacterium]
MRLDKYLAESGLGTRSEVKTFIKKGRITVDDVLVKSDKMQIDANLVAVKFDGVPVVHQTLFYYMLNKPAGLVSVTQDNVHQTVMSLLRPGDYRADLFPAGRLDKDTTGLLLLTNDGDLAHHLLSPHKHVAKEYHVRVDGHVTKRTIEAFAAGVALHGEKGNPFVGELTLETITKDDVMKSGYQSLVRLVIHRGVYHQVKRMFRAVGMEVKSLQRVRMGSLVLDAGLSEGDYRALSDAELRELQKTSGACLE